MPMINVPREHGDRLKAYRPHGDQPHQTNVLSSEAAMVEVLQKAIEQRMTLRIGYAPGLREIEPHALGLSADGNYLLRAWQVKGAAHKGEHTAWKLFRLDAMDEVVHIGPVFEGPREGYRKGDRAMKGGITAEL